MTARTYGGRASFLVRATDRPSEIQRSRDVSEHLRSNGTNTVDLDPVTLRAGLRSPEHPRRLINEPNDIDYRLYNTTIDYDFGPVALVSSTSYGTLDQTHLFEDARRFTELIA